MSILSSGMRSPATSSAGISATRVLVSEGATEIDCVVVHMENRRMKKRRSTLPEQGGRRMGAGGAGGPAGRPANRPATTSECDRPAPPKWTTYSPGTRQDVSDDGCDIDPEEIAPFVQPGDIWTLGRHRMLCGDATNPEDVARLMNGLRANLIVTDPPYNVSYQARMANPSERQHG